MGRKKSGTISRAPTWKVAGSEAASEPQKPRFSISPLVERAVLERPEFARGLALAMARSAINATERIAALPQTPEAETQPLKREQRRLSGRLEKSGPNGFLTYEARIMIQYWRCFNLPLRRGLSKGSGPASAHGS